MSFQSDTGDDAGDDDDDDDDQDFGPGLLPGSCSQKVQYGLPPPPQTDAD